MKHASSILSGLLVVTLLVPGAQADALVPPSPPQNVTVTTTADGVQVDWDAPLFDGGASQVTYNVYRGSTLVGTDIVATDFLDAQVGLSSASASSYRVTAVNEAGESMHDLGVCVVLNPPGVDPLGCVGVVTQAVIWALQQLPIL